MAKNSTPAGATPAPRQAAHTPEPWLQSRTSNGYSIYAHGSAIALVEPDDEQTRANAERIASCVNALEGVSNPAAVKRVIEIARSVVLAIYEERSVVGPLSSSLDDALTALDTPVPKTEEIS